MSCNIIKFRGNARAEHQRLESKRYSGYSMKSQHWKANSAGKASGDTLFPTLTHKSQFNSLHVNHIALAQAAESPSPPMSGSIRQLLLN